ncbi:hypothetical protein QN372_00480 [Undibacterium sp. RTI2.1]|uniref:hypothetical protein n=1 Tax=unclassified Undibacterium TaxID=2630295 RepID=UPI002AB47C14|nr:MULTISPECIES: hypothetical protein [unclassified Undibacterium]MDY7537614.1 hypothetical protein [Undibacterium sp. 5I1]MEB0029215.1 hypothetical protein [Undibacterium sp. RTI2.1]MEB0115523.1 hypothetical protein [Undibacterium sp. RTI2.2]MEB0230159.1 hypothetical protein [Undibacterium sp. 10I3]MEB0256351.1 hypothetical protein [Undibacterium sp. 5I1]
MGVKVEGFMSANELLMRIDTTAKRRVVKSLIQKGVELRDMAKKMAPRDHANLEDAIKMRPEGAERLRDDLGRFAKVEIEVYIDMDTPVPERPGKTVGDYAYEIHEHQTPMGSIQLGEKSLEKQDSNGGVQVGGGFMYRAVEAVDKEIDFALQEALNEVF